MIENEKVSLRLGFLVVGFVFLGLLVSWFRSFLVFELFVSWFHVVWFLGFLMCGFLAYRFLVY